MLLHFLLVSIRIRRTRHVINFAQLHHISSKPLWIFWWPCIMISPLLFFLLSIMINYHMPKTTFEVESSPQFLLVFSSLRADLVVVHSILFDQPLSNLCRSIFLFSRSVHNHQKPLTLSFLSVPSLNQCRRKPLRDRELTPSFNHLWSLVIHLLVFTHRDDGEG